MSTLFSVQYVGRKGIGVAAICIGNGTIIGFDGADGRYEGRYVEEGGRIRGRLKMSYRDEWPLVTGASVQPGDAVELAFDWPREFADGEPQQLYLKGEPVTITARKIGEL